MSSGSNLSGSSLSTSASMPLIHCSELNNLENNNSSNINSPTTKRQMDDFLLKQQQQQQQQQQHGPESSNRAVLADNLRKLRSNTQRLQSQRQDGCLANLTGGKSQTILVSGQDAKLKFTIEPKPGEDAFYQWRDGMRAVARLPNGIPVEFRRKVWLSLAEFYLASQRLDWQRIRKLCFNDRLNPDDDSLDHQIVKDLHRTGCEEFGSEHDRAVLKRVLLAYARWNKRVGYCQGFNVLAALILEVMERNEDEALKVMIFLVDSCLPESYFAQNLQALTVDMAVFRQLLRAHLPQLSNHLDRLQAAASAAHAASSPATAAVVYEPPLVNVFTIQWFLTLFSTCLPAFATLRLWDAIMLEGSEMLLRCALVLWRKLQAKILKEADSADAFYCHMGEITALLNSEALITTEQLIEELYASMSEIPSVAISELRERFTFNIKPFSAAVGGGSRSRSGKSAGRGDSAFGGNDPAGDDLDILGGNGGSMHASGGGNGGGSGGGGSLGIGCFSAALKLAGGGSNAPLPHSASTGAGLSDLSALQQQQQQSSDRNSTALSGLPRTELERRNTNLNHLMNNYRKLQSRQLKASLVIASAGGGGGNGGAAATGNASSSCPSGPSSGLDQPVMNHLLLGRPNLQQSAMPLTSVSSPPPATDATPTPKSPAASPASPILLSASSSSSSPKRPETLLAMVSKRLDTVEEQQQQQQLAELGDSSAQSLSNKTSPTVQSTKTQSPLSASDCSLGSAISRTIDRQRASPVKKEEVKTTAANTTTSSSSIEVTPVELSGCEEGGAGSREWLSSSTVASQQNQSSIPTAYATPNSGISSAVAVNPHLLRGSRLRFGAQFGLYKSVRTQLQQPASLAHH